MVRTRAEAGPTKVSAAKAPRKVFNISRGGPGTSVASPGRISGKDKYSGGNSYNPQPTPDWQKGIGSFFKSTPRSNSNLDDGCSSSTFQECEAKKTAAESGESSLANDGMTSDDKN